MSNDFSAENEHKGRGILNKQQTGDVLKTFAQKALQVKGVDIAMILVNEDGSPMTAKQFLDVVEHDGPMFHNLTQGGTKPILPLTIKVRCGCRYTLTEKQWPEHSLTCKHGNILVKIN